ncbi:MAG TPA: hypothetical protein VMU83_00255 [Hanamia sp.]|nr:hypothetical protein [Hanamia sp.]
MIPLITDYYTHEFNEDEGVTVAFFSTKTSTKYRVYFYPAKDFFDYIKADSVIYLYGYYFGFTKIAPNEDKKEHYDPRIRNTIVTIINEFYNSKENNSILIFHCSNDWGNDKKYKRAKTFDNWFLLADCSNTYKSIMKKL